MVPDTQKGSIVFLVRPDGVYTYNRAAHTARINQAHSGKLPINGQGNIDLGAFNKPSP